MLRGKPCSEQLNLSKDLLGILNNPNDIISNGVDYRNYGLIDGIPEAKELFAEVFEVDSKEIIIGGVSSLRLMYDTITHAIIKGIPDSSSPWSNFKKIKFLCPSPGYDRHFKICESLNIEMITIPMDENGPDMSIIEELVASDETIKGIWCVPKYSNPTGITYSDDVVDRLATMKTKAIDFKIIWDNAYALHHLDKEQDELKDIFKMCKKYGNDERVIMFYSTSKITIPGGSISILCASETIINTLKKSWAIQTTGQDKLNQLRHVKFLKSPMNIYKHMQKHSEIIRPKFNIVLDILEKELGGKNIAQWSKPNGGYFISLNTMEGCANEVISMAAKAGILLTEAGVTFPYGKDLLDRNIRIAPTYPSKDDLSYAIELLCICIKLVTIKKILSNFSL